MSDYKERMAHKQYLILVKTIERARLTETVKKTLTRRVQTFVKVNDGTRAATDAKALLEKLRPETSAP